MNRELVWRSIIFRMNLPENTWYHPSFHSTFAGLQRGNFANVLECVTYFPRTSLNPWRVMLLFFEALSLSSSWKLSHATWPHSARASLGGSSACESPKPLASPNPARFIIILCDAVVSYLHCTVRRSWHTRIRECGHERHWHNSPGRDEGGERRALGLSLCCHLLRARTRDNKYLYQACQTLGPWAPCLVYLAGVSLEFDMLDLDNEDCPKQKQVRWGWPPRESLATNALSHRAVAPTGPYRLQSRPLLPKEPPDKGHLVRWHFNWLEI